MVITNDKHQNVSRVRLVFLGDISVKIDERGLFAQRAFDGNVAGNGSLRRRVSAGLRWLLSAHPSGGFLARRTGLNTALTRITPTKAK